MIEHNLATKQDWDFIESLIEEVNLGEPFDYGAQIYILKSNEEKVGLFAFNFQKTDNGILPVFEHILVRPKYQRTRMGVRLMIQMEKTLVGLGYQQFLSNIKKDNERMKKYADKWGMKPYYKNNGNIWYYKNLGG